MCPDKKLPGDNKDRAALLGYGAAVDAWCAGAALARGRRHCLGRGRLALAGAAGRGPLRFLLLPAGGGVVIVPREARGPAKCT